MKLIDRIFNKLAYKYSKERLEQIEAIDREIKRCEEDIEKTKEADNFSCSWYESEGAIIVGRIVDVDYTIQIDMMRRIILVGLEAYKEELISKKNKLL